MQTCGGVIRLALKKLGVLRQGAEPSAADGADALASLQSFYQEQITSGAFGRVRSVIATADVTAQSGQHINNTGPGTIIVTLPTTVEDWWWYEDRVPADLSVVISTDLTNTRLTHLYDGRIQRWVDLETLTMESEAPLSSRGFDGLASLLAVRMADQFGAELLSPTTIRSANRFQLSLVEQGGIDEDPDWKPPYWDYGFPANYY